MAKDDNPTQEHLEAVSENVEAQRSDDAQDTGPDPIVEAVEKQAAEAEKDRKDVKDEDKEPPAFINPKAEGLSDEEIKANEEKALKQQEVGESNWDDVVSGVNPDGPTAGTTTEEARSSQKKKGDNA